MSRCGICNAKPKDADSQLTCKSCINFLMMKDKIQYLDALGSLSKSKSIINNILRKCIKDENYSFIKSHIDGTQSYQDLSPSFINPTIALSQQLLTIDSILIQKQNNKLVREINHVKLKIQEKRKLLEKKRQLLSKKQESLNLFEINSKKKDSLLRDKPKAIQSQTENLHDITKSLKNAQSLHFQQLLQLYMIKRRRKNEDIFLIRFIPMIAVKHLLLYDIQLLNASLFNVAKFTYQLSSILLIEPKFKFEIKREIILIGGFDITIPEKEEQVNQSKNIDLLTIPDHLLVRFMKSLSRLIINVYDILVYLDLADEVKTYSQLLNIDQMIFKLAFNDFKISNEKSLSDDDIEIVDSKIDVDALHLMILQVYRDELKKRAPEWHIVEPIL